jgi:hypothetical protein
MTQTQNLDAVKNLFSFSSLKNLPAPGAEDNFLKIIKKDNETSAAMELPVNNYLKTPEEIEKEFNLINSHKAAFQERKDSSAYDDAPISERPGYINIHSLDEALLVSMEENY